MITHEYLNSLHLKNEMVISKSLKVKQPKSVIVNTFNIKYLNNTDSVKIRRNV